MPLLARHGVAACGERDEPREMMAAACARVVCQGRIRIATHSLRVAVHHTAHAARLHRDRVTAAATKRVRDDEPQRQHARAARGGGGRRRRRALRRRRAVAAAAERGRAPQVRVGGVRVAKLESRPFLLGVKGGSLPDMPRHRS